jgi:hypothetical protein
MFVLGSINFTPGLYKIKNKELLHFNQEIVKQYMDKENACYSEI